MSLSLRYQFIVVSLVIVSSIQMIKMIDSPRDVEQDESLTDELIAEFEREELSEQSGGWLMKGKCKARNKHPPVQGRFAKDAVAQPVFYQTFSFAKLTTTTAFNKINTIVDDSNLTAWETFSKEFEPCLHMPNAWHQFRLSMQPNGLFVLSNISVPTSDISTVTGLLKMYYDVALWRINQLSDFNQKNKCFQLLNNFICGIQMENLNQYKLQVVACCRMNMSYSPVFAPQYSGKSLLNDNSREVCKSGDSGIYVQFDGNYYLYARIPLDMQTNEINYFEEGCLNFFSQRVEGGLGYYRPDAIACAPKLINILTLSFPDGSTLTSNASSILDVIYKYWTCQLLEILAIRNRENRMCFVELFLKNFDQFMAEAVPQLKMYALDIDKLIVFQSLIQKQRVMMKTLAARYEPIAHKIIAFTKTPALLKNSTETFNLTAELAVLNPDATSSQMYSDADDPTVNLQIIRKHILHCLYIICAVAFCLIVFMAVYIIWLSYMAYIARLKIENRKAALLLDLTSEN